MYFVESNTHMEPYNETFYETYEENGSYNNN